MGSGRRYRHVERILARFYRGGRVLEIGAGGAVYRDLFEEYVGLDLPGTPYAGQGDLSVYGDARALPFGMERFDMVFSVATLYAIPRPEIVCQEIWMSLKEGGVFLLFDYAEGTQVRALRNNLRRGQKRTFNFWKGKELRRMLYDAGFSCIRQQYRNGWEGGLFRMFPLLEDRWGQWLIFKGEKR